MSNRLFTVLLFGSIWFLFGFRMFVLGFSGAWWGVWLLVGIIIFLLDPSVYSKNELVDKDGWFGIHPSLRAIWRHGYNEEGKRLD